MVRACVIGDGRWVPPGVEDEEWHGVVTLDGVPVSRVRLPDPGEADEAFRRAVVDRHADGHRSYSELLERIERRLGVPKHEPAALTTSVVVCTHRRPDMLAGLLEAVERLDPSPHELIVVDNDPGEHDVRSLVERAGALCVREDRRGLDNARRAGTAAAGGDLIAFTDDDCLPSERWLRDLPELFDDPRVAAVTGPAFAHELATPAQRAFEEAGGFGRGFHRRVHEWSNLSPPGATRAGAGANMILRRTVVDELGELFPSELDAGTATQSGGDLYALYRILAAGYRVVYDPGTYVLHRHRPDLESMQQTIRGYGVGLSAALTKLLVEERELGAFGAWSWLIKQWLESLAGDEDRRRIGREYLRGGFGGPAALRRAKKSAGCQVSGVGSQKTLADTRHHAPDTQCPVVSVIVTTRDRPEALRRCLDALARQEPGTPPFEVIVVNDARKPLRDQPAGARVIDTGGVGTGAARNAGATAARGDILLFLDDDLLAEPDLVARHVAAQREERVVIGYCTPRPRHRNLASFGAAAWWEDHYRALRDAASLTFMDVLSGNMSVPRATFRRVGGFDPELGRREDWEWGIRVLEAGVNVVYEPGARASHEFRFGTRVALRAGRKHGRSDAALIALRPAAAAALPTRWGYRDMLRRPLKAALFLTFQRSCGQALGCLALDLFERAKLRPSWARLFGLMLGAAYERGRRDGGDPRRPAQPLPVTEIELDSDEPIAAPGVIAPRVRLLAQGEPVAEFSSYGGHWGRRLAEQVASEGHWEWWRRTRPATGEVLDTELIEEPTWRERDDAIRASRASTVVIPLVPAPVPGRWVTEAAVATRAGRVALALGAGLDEGEPPYPVALHSRRTNPGSFPALGRPPAYLALSRSAYLLLGGFDLRLARHGDEAVLLELVERALQGGWLVARRDVAGLPISGRAATLRTTRARAILHARAARERSQSPPLRPALVRIAAGLAPGGPTFSGGIAHAAAWLSGIAAVAARPRYRTAALSPAAFDPASGPASQRWAGRMRPSPAERPVTRSG
jgi:GT2 family glycosyltransferase